MLFFIVLLAFCGQQTLAQYPAGACPEPYGIQTYPDEKYCDKFYKVIKWKVFYEWYLKCVKSLPLVYLQVIFNERDAFFISMRPQYDNWLLIRLYKYIRIFNKFSNCSFCKKIHAVIVVSLIQKKLWRKESIRNNQLAELMK